MWYEGSVSERRIKERGRSDRCRWGVVGGVAFTSKLGEVLAFLLLSGSVRKAGCEYYA